MCRIIDDSKREINKYNYFKVVREDDGSVFGYFKSKEERSDSSFMLNLAVAYDMIFTESDTQDKVDKNLKEQLKNAEITEVDHDPDIKYHEVVF